jgi:mycothiol synthase
VHLEVKQQMGRGDIAAVSELLQVAEAADGHQALGDHQWIDLVDGGREGFAGLVAWEPGHDHPVGYAQVTRGPQSWALEFVVDPHHRAAGNPIARQLVAEALRIISSEGGGHVHLWVYKPSEDTDHVVTGLGLSRGRDLLQMRLPLPLPAAVAAAGEVDVRPFVPGQDEATWLEVNNRAFLWHPEQGGWDLETLRRREEEAWFDPAGFLLHERGGRLAAFCWTKIHADHDPPLGEIYVVAVDPDFQGLGLGRHLTVAGLNWLADKGLTVGMLYVDAANEAAVTLYEHLGFTRDHIDRAYVGDVAPASP